MTEAHWTYNSRDGRFYRPGGEFVTKGYSGNGDAKNDPDREDDVAMGPIPRGLYTIGQLYQSQRVGRDALPLEPKGHNAFGRSAFRIHGDSIAHPGTASHGCIILPHDVRLEIAASACKLLLVA